MASIGVYGATGYTGRFVAAELAVHGHRVILGGRDIGRLAEVASASVGLCDIHGARIDDPKSLRRFANRCSVIINCAGPFSRYGLPVAEAAIAAGVHYLDHAAEPAYLRRLTRELDGSARSAGSAVVAGMSFFTGLADLIAHRLAAHKTRLHTVTVAYAVNHWQLTSGSRKPVATQSRCDRLIYRNDMLQVLPQSAETELSEYSFPPPTGIQPVITSYQGCGAPVTVPRHTNTGAIETYMTAATFRRGPHVTSTLQREYRDAPTEFTIVVDTHTRTERHRGWIAGDGDLYEIAASISAKAAEQLVAGKISTTGVLGPAQAYAESRLLNDLTAMRFVHGGLHEENCPSDVTNGPQIRPHGTDPHGQIRHQTLNRRWSNAYAHGGRDDRSADTSRQRPSPGGGAAF